MPTRFTTSYRIWIRAALSLSGLLGVKLALLSFSLSLYAETPSTLSEAARWLQAYLRIDTTNPPGNEHRAAAYLGRILNREGISHQLLVTPEGRVNLAAKLEARDEDRMGGTLVLLHHMDVVPPGPDWSVAPFSGQVKDGAIWGRGAIDTKGLGIAQLAAFVELKRRKVRLQRDVLLLAVADEESGGGRGTEWLLQHHEELFGQVDAVLNEGGSNRTVNGRTLWWGVEVSQKRPLWLRIRTVGRGGHGSGLNPFSATHQLVAALDRLRQLPLRYQVTPAVREYLEAIAPLHNEPYRSHFRDIDKIISEEGPSESLLPGMANLFVDTIQITVIEAGERINTIAAAAHADVDIRLMPVTDTEVFLERVRTAVGDEAQVEVLLSYPPYPDSPRGSIFQLITKHLAEGEPVVPTFISGFTDSRFFRQRGWAAYGISPFALEPQELRGIHGPDERLPIAELNRGVERMRRVVFACAQKP